MTLQRDAAELFGLAGSFPRPGWVVLDAARDHRFTGELVFDAEPRTRLYLDRGQIYLAEREGDASLGARLIDAGALSATQLEHGAMRVGDAEYLGRLFDRVPSVDRQFVVVMVELMNDACVTKVAQQNIAGVDMTPYLRHPSGVHRWTRPDSIDLRPGDPLPAPEPTDAPVDVGVPETIFDATSNDTDALIRWDEPSWLDDRVAAPEAHARALGEPMSTSLLDTDWADRLEEHGLPTPDDDPLASPTPLPPVDAVAADRFEIIWPSGQVDESFGGVETVSGDNDRDRVGPTARVSRTSVAARDDARPDETSRWERHDTPTTEPATPEPPRSPASTAPVAEATDLETTVSLASVEQLDEQHDIAIATRRAVATIDTGALDARRRLAEGAATTPPDTSVWAATSTASPSVFEEPASDPTESSDTTDDGPLPTEPVGDGDDAPRVSALRRLIGGLRRR